MNFQDLKTIEKPDFYLDVAFGRASKKAKELRIKKRDRVSKTKEKELARLNVIRDVLADNFNKIIHSFPSLDKLDKFYQELIKATLSYGDIKKSLGSVDWATKQINSLTGKYSKGIRKSQDIGEIIKLRKEYYGRISSIVKQIKKYLVYLEESRKTMRSYPSIKTSVFTVSIFGFPNVGKSTLLSKLTDATPEIQSYAFTTKKLNLGYIKDPLHKVQLIDTPGTLNRINKMNPIEFQAYLAVKYLANLVVYVFDPTFQYELEKQEKLLSRLKKYKKEILIYLSKTDLAEKNVIEKFKKDYPSIITDAEKLKEKIKAYVR